MNMLDENILTRLREAFPAGGPKTPSVSPGRENLTDEEMREAIRDALNGNGTVETQELKIR